MSQASGASMSASREERDHVESPQPGSAATKRGSFGMACSVMTWFALDVQHVRAGCRYCASARASDSPAGSLIRCRSGTVANCLTTVAPAAA